MKNIFDLTKGEQRLVIVIVAALVAVAFAKHFFENRSHPISPRSTSAPTPVPTIQAEKERPEPDTSR
jgi:hypothetical protein